MFVKRSIMVGSLCAGMGLAAGCGSDAGESESISVPTLTKVVEVTRVAPASAEPPAPARCEPFVPDRAHPALALRDGQPAASALICPDEETFEAQLSIRDRLDGPALRVPRTFKDPLPQLTGMEIYDHAIEMTARLAWFVPVLFDGTPPLGSEQVKLLDANKRLAREFSDIWSTEGGGTPKPYAWTGGMRWRKIDPLIKKYSKHKWKLRTLLLRDGGVLYVEDARAASDIYRFVSVSDLFDDEVVWHRRGDAIHKLTRLNRRTYAFAEGPRAGQRVRLLIFDRLAPTRQEVEGRLGWDLLRLRPELALKAFQVRRQSHDLLRGRAVTRTGLQIDAAAFELDGALTLALIIPSDKRRETLAQFNRDRAGSAIKKGIIKAAEDMVAEELRFDEPLTEEGQQDGHLRPTWQDAYNRGLHSYRYNGDRYTVFTKAGRPNVPQVCVDFVYDTVERWSGKWWAPKGEPRTRREGFVDVDTWVSKVERRKVSQLVEMAAEHPDRLDLVLWSSRDQIPYSSEAAFYARLEKLGDSTLPADIFTIHGLKLDGRNHWHSFLIYDLDPIYNTPWLVIGNTGHARIQPWHAVMRTGPKRAITARIRWREDWLEAQRSSAHHQSPPSAQR